MMVAGVGCMKGTSSAAVLETVRAAMAQHRVPAASLSALATGGPKREEAGIFAAAEALGIEVMLVDDAALTAAASRTLSHSVKSVEHTGLPSLCEAAALAAAGPQSALLGPRIVLAGVTCALASTPGDQS